MESFLGFLVVVCMCVVAAVMWKQGSNEWKHRPEDAVRELRARTDVQEPTAAVPAVLRGAVPRDAETLGPSVPSTLVRVTAKTVRVKHSGGFNVRYLAVFGVGSNTAIPPRSGSVFQGRWFVPTNQPTNASGTVYDGARDQEDVLDWRRVVLDNGDASATLSSTDGSTPMFLTLDYGEEVYIHAIVLRKRWSFSTLEGAIVELSDNSGRVVWARRVVDFDATNYATLGAV